MSWLSFKNSHDKNLKRQNQLTHASRNGRSKPEMSVTKFAALTAAALAFTLAGCGGSTPTPAPASTSKAAAPAHAAPAAKPARPTADAGASLSCGHYGNVMADAAAGILTGPELRDKVKEINNNARVSENTGIAGAAQDMLAAATADDAPGFVVAGKKFRAACDLLSGVQG